MKEKPKLRYCIKEIFGDYYWAETNPEETIEYTFKRLPKNLEAQN